MPASKINPGRMAALLKSMEQGNYLKYAAEAAGISARTAYNWMTRGSDGLERAAKARPGIEDEIADWIAVFPDNFNHNNAIWDAPTPLGFVEDDWTYVLLFTLAKKADARAVAKHVNYIRKASSDGSWQASAWWLERTHPQEFGRQKLTQLGNAEGLEQETVDPAPAEQVIAAVRELTAGKNKP